MYKFDIARKCGRPPYDAVLMLKVLVLQIFYNLYDDQSEFQIRDRYSFCRFLSLSPDGKVPDTKAIWVFRERFKKLELFDKFFTELLAQIDAAGFTACKGQIADAAFIPTPKERDSREENARIQAGEIPEDRSESRRRQKDVDARWTQKHGNSHDAYKNHIRVDNPHKVIHHYAVTSTEVHDSQVFEQLLDESSTSAVVWAESAYRDKAREQVLAHANFRSRIYRETTRGRPLSKRAQKAHRKPSKVRSQVENVFAQQVDRLIRTMSQARAAVKIGFVNLLYNMCRYAWLAATG